MKILVADCHWAVRAGIKPVLKELDDDVSIVESKDFAETLAIAGDQTDFDLVLLDPLMPDMGLFFGIEAICVKFYDVPVVVISDIDSRDTILHSIELGAAGFIPTTSSSQDILDAIRLVLSGGVAIPRALLDRRLSASPRPNREPRSAQAARAMIETLTPRQREVLRLLGHGKSNAEIASELKMAESTVRVHTSAILKALKAGSRTKAALIAASYFADRPDTDSGVS
jgi:DNA-binding NarL/FixJ family response regulator